MMKINIITPTNEIIDPTVIKTVYVVYFHGPRICFVPSGHSINYLFKWQEINNVPLTYSGFYFPIFVHWKSRELALMPIQYWWLDKQSYPVIRLLGNQEHILPLFSWRSNWQLVVCIIFCWYVDVGFSWVEGTRFDVGLHNLDPFLRHEAWVLFTFDNAVPQGFIGRYLFYF